MSARRFHGLKAQNPFKVCPPIERKAWRRWSGAAIRSAIEAEPDVAAPEGFSEALTPLAVARSRDMERTGVSRTEIRRSLIGYATSRPSRDLVVAARQQLTRE
ncbi:MAG: hypothetical protein RL885_05060 [Planctomycetota bacterium]